MNEILTVIPEFEHLLNESLIRIRHCVRQLSEEQIWWRAHETHNSIGNLLLHIAGNLDQWCVAGLGDLPDVRDRAAEFAARGAFQRGELLDRVQTVVTLARETLSRLTSEDLATRRTIQNFDVTGLQALFHTVPHFVGHTHQVTLITRQLLGDAYEFDFSPETFNRPGVPL